ncbi:TonB-dependent receptor [Mucilaginibacter robiniae]|uniref:TonB-dependent receptor n=1 Tax=Mucilaginibacter robiniae TaxID=2728022 RepID=A0A7L5DV60_9SPHI|nr:TonB-dependent receptor [Mucilaginibacter robiniae]QJD94601.1 TonB-dependent receptor [Mucilaginibacter robiniae]
MNKFLLNLCLLLLCCTAAWAQTRQITGKVTEKDSKEPVVGATVSIRGTTSGTQTAVDGTYKLNVPDRAGVVVVIRYVGFKQQEFTLTAGQTTINAALENDSRQLDEVVAIGYQTVKRRDVNGAVSSVNATQLKDIPVTSLGEALAGRLAGVQITQSEGSPDAAVRVLVRGGGSITQNNDPLYVIDGVQVENGLSTLSPQDIQSIDVLKDAASTAIYGARGANGVVIITTKGGREQPTTVTYNGRVGFKSLARELQVLNPYDFVLYQYERSRGNATDSTSFANDYGNDFGALSRFQSVPFVDWQKKTLGRTGFQQQHNISITGGSKSTQFNLSFTDDNQNETVINSMYDRKLINFRMDHTASSKFRFGFNARYNAQAVSGAGTSSTQGSTYNNLRNTIKYRPFDVPGIPDDQVDPTLYAESNAAGNNLGVLNPIVNSNAQYRKNYTYVTDLNGYLNYTFNKYLSFRSTLGVDFNRQKLNSFDDAITFNARINGSGQPLAGINQINTNTLDLSNVLTFNNSAANPKHHDVNLIIGNEFYNLHSDGLNNQFKLFPAGISAESALNQLNQGTIIPGYPTVSNSTSHLLSFFARGNYTLDKKYTATFTMRADGSSKFAPGHQWGYFPSGSLTWRVSEENFMKNITAISDLKLRLSYGTSGNNRIADYLTQTLYNTGTNTLYTLNESTTSIGIAPTNLVNQKLKWETTASTNIGLDFGMINNKIQVSLDAYQGTTRNLLISVPVPTSSGYTTQLQNVGKTQNRGVEAQFNAYIIQSKSFSWSANFNVAYNVNKVLALAPGQDSYFAYSGWGVSGQPADFIVQVGKPVGSVYGYVSDGFYKTSDFNYNAATNQYTLKSGVVDPSKTIGTAQPGLVRYKDLNGDGVITSADQTILGNTNPKITGGLNQMFTYKGFDASIFINFQAAAKVLNASKIEFSNGYTANTNLLGTAKDRWRTVDANGNVTQKLVTVNGSTVAVGAAPAVLDALNANAKTSIPVTGAAAFYVTSDDVENAAFARVNNVTLGYTFSPALLRRVSVKKLRVFVTANNLAIVTSYTGFDPDVNTRRATPVTPGVDYSSYPRSHTYLMGVNLTL